jgi:excisionase family DNA binding protein
MVDDRSNHSEKKELMKILQVMDELSLDRKTILKLIHQGKLAALRIGNLWFVTRHDLNSYLEMLRQRYENEFRTP